MPRYAGPVVVTPAEKLKVPNALRPVVDEVIGITDAVCLAALDEEYADLARRAAAKLARKRPSPLVGGRRSTWAAGIVYALGQVNFLFDPESGFGVTADQLSEAFGVAKSTMSSKAKQVRDLLGISPYSLEFQRADVVEQNSLVWFIEVDGLIVDARNVPLNIQMEAYQLGLIPYVPAFGPDSQAARKESSVAGTASAAESTMAGLVERSAVLKRQLVSFARSPRFSGELDDAIRESGISGEVDERDSINFLDRFILQRPLADGRTVVEVFAAEHPELSEADRQMVLAWREVVEGVFEIREQTGDALIAVNLVDDVTYRIRSNRRSGTMIPPGFFMTARVVPIGGDWLLSGMSELFPASDSAAMNRLAAERSAAAGH